MKTRIFALLALSAVLFSSSAFADEIFPITHCRLVNTRNLPAPYYIVVGNTYTFDATLANNSLQGGQATSCGIPSCATAIVASVVAVNPTGPGYWKFWETGGVYPPVATGLNFFLVWDVTVSNYPAAIGRLAIIKLAGGKFSVKGYWFDGQLMVDAQAYLGASGCRP